MRNAMAVLLSTMLVMPAAQAQPSTSRPIKQQVLDIQQGTPVEVRLTDKTKLRGRLGPVTDSGFELETVKGQNIVKAQVAFDQVKSIKDTTKTTAGHTARKALIITGVVFGVSALLGLIMYATGHQS